MKRTPVIFAALGALFLAAPPVARGAAPNFMVEQGRVLDANGAPINGLVTFQFMIHTQPTAAGDMIVWSEAQNVTLDDGYFSARLGETTALDPKEFDGKELYLGVSVNGDPEMTPRQTLDSVPYAFVANDAVGDIHPTSVTVGGTTVINAMGNWVGPNSGLVGPQGPQGLQGPAGPAGADGAQGPVGPPGLPGPAGMDGAIGPAGPQGPQGATGATGAAGAQGPQGPAGPVLTFIGLENNSAQVIPAGSPVVFSRPDGQNNITITAAFDGVILTAPGTYCVHYDVMIVSAVSTPVELSLTSNGTTMQMTTRAIRAPTTNFQLSGEGIFVNAKVGDTLKLVNTSAAALSLANQGAGGIVAWMQIQQLM
jgi:hypothetical protein